MQDQRNALLDQHVGMLNGSIQIVAAIQAQLGAHTMNETFNDRVTTSIFL